MGGYDAKVEATPTSIITTTKKRPLYEGLPTTGIDHNTIEAFCRGNDEAGDAQFKQLVDSYAGVKMRKVSFRPDDYCIK
jgi:hypothetical protein